MGNLTEYTLIPKTVNVQEVHNETHYRKLEKSKGMLGMITLRVNNLICMGLCCFNLHYHWLLKSLTMLYLYSSSRLTTAYIPGYRSRKLNPKHWQNIPDCSSYQHRFAVELQFNRGRCFSYSNKLHLVLSYKSCLTYLARYRKRHLVGENSRPHRNSCKSPQNSHTVAGMHWSLLYTHWCLLPKRYIQNWEIMKLRKNVSAIKLSGFR